MTWTRLHDACQRHDFRLATSLAQCFSEEAMMVDDHSSTPLHIACWGNPPIEVIIALLSAWPHAANDKDILGNTPLHIAAANPNTDPAIIREILEVCPTAASIMNKEGLMPLHMACRHASSNEGVISSLIDAYPYALQTRIRMGSLVPSKKNKRSPVQGEGLHFVTDLAGKSNLASSEIIYGDLSRQVRDGAYPLHMAVRAGAPVNVVERILRENSDLVMLINKYGETVLHVALSAPSSEANEEVVELMLNDTSNRLALSGLRDKQSGNLPIHTAAKHGCSVETAKGLILLHPHSIHEKNKELKTPLDLAIEHGNCSDQVIRLLEISEHSESSLF